jgi:hypothetical protein
MITTCKPRRKWPAAIALLALSIGCYGPQQAARQVDRAILEQPAVAAGELRRAFPFATGHTDTVTVTQDSLVLIDCPEMATVHDTVINSLHDTLITVRHIKVPVHLPVEIRYITQYVKDKADSVVILSLQADLNRIRLADAVHKGLSDKWKWIAICCMILLGAGIVLRIKSMIK